MTKVYGQLAVIGLMVASLSACQGIDTVRIKHVKETESTKTNALIYCSGTANCEFERLDKIQIIDAVQRRVNSAAVESGILRLQANSLSQPNALYLSVPPGQHELVIRFYPISKDRAETLHVFHQFKPKQHYIFKMYRERNKQQGSLLNVSAPEPLCVDLLQDQKAIRRFCRPYNALTGLGESVEKKI